MNLDKNLCVRLSNESVRLIEQTSQELGLASSTYCRMIIIEHLRKKEKFNEGVTKK